MEETLIDWEKIFQNEDPGRTAVIISPLDHFDHPLVTETVDSKQYGAIETTRYGRMVGKSFLVIQFKDATSAKNFIAKGSIVMWQTPFIVTSFQSNDEATKTIEHMTFTHPPYYTPTEPERPDDNILNVLNDDCLGEVFRRMDPWDRIRIENVCTRFKRVAEKAFLSVHKKNDIWLSYLNPDGNPTLTEIEKFLRCYGPSINRVSLIKEDYKHIADGLNSILKLLATYCPNLKKLYLFTSDRGDRMGLDTQTLTEIRPLLSKLTDLFISCRSLRICNEVIAACDEIENLRLNVIKIDTVLPGIKFPKLKTCDFSDAQNGMLDGFFAQNPQIKSLKIPYVTGIIQLISEKIPNLRELSITQISEPLSINDSVCLRSFKHANISIFSSHPRLILGESRENLFKVTNITSLKLKSFDFFNLNILVELTRHLWKLEKMGIYCDSKQTVSKDLIKEILRPANKLAKLHICGLRTDQFREQDYNDILHIVKNRSDPVGLNIILRISCHQPGKHSQKTFFLNTHPRWLTITSHYKIH